MYVFIIEFMVEIYYYIINLQKDSEERKHNFHLNGIQLYYCGNTFSDDEGDERTFRNVIIAIEKVRRIWFTDY